jgi:integrase/recombinase XerC
VRRLTNSASVAVAWLAAADTAGDPLNARDARDWTVRDYRTHLHAVLKRRPATVNNALAAIDDLYMRRGLGPANATRADLPRTAPKALTERAAVRFLRAVEARDSPRDKAIALIPFYAGARIAEVVGLDVDDVQLSARKGNLRIYGKGDKVREIPIHPQLRAVLSVWLDERPDWPGADDRALFLNQRGSRLSAKGAHDIITAIAATAGLDDDTTTHVLRHTFATRMVRGGTDLVVVAELLGHARLETTRGYTRPTHEDVR